MCGFECGILLDDINSFDKVHPWYQWMQETTEIGHWGILPENMHRICEAESYYVAYALIKKYAGDVGSQKVKECFAEAEYIIDKTPRYLYCLDSVIEKIEIPFIVIKKDVLTQYMSHKRRGCGLDIFIQRYQTCMLSLKKARDKYPDRILMVEYDCLLNDKERVLTEIYKFINFQLYPDSSTEEFFKRTGLRENTFVNEYGGMSSTFFQENPQLGLSGKEITILKKQEDFLNHKSVFLITIMILLTSLKHICKKLVSVFNPSLD